MITALFWVITQLVVVIYYRRFGTTYRSYLQGSTFHTHVLSVSGLTHDILTYTNVPFWSHTFICYLSCAALSFAHSHTNSYYYMLQCLLAPSSGSLGPTEFPSQNMKYLRALVSCLFKTAVFSQIRNILSEEAECTKGSW
jgi:hypothetical protein